MAGFELRVIMIGRIVFALGFLERPIKTGNFFFSAYDRISAALTFPPPSEYKMNVIRK